MPLFRTETCAAVGHAEFTLTFDHEPPSSAAVAWLLGVLQDMVADGTRFTSGDMIRIGWRVLRVVDRADATLGLQERIADDVWEEHVDRAVNDVYWQSGAAHQLDQPEDLYAVGEDDVALVQACAFNAHSMILLRVESARGYAWAVSCGNQEHEHDDWSPTSLLQLSTDLPALTQFFTLPVGVGVLIELGAINSVGGVVAVVAYDGHALTPEGGAHFGPESPPADYSGLRAHTAIINMGDGLRRTTAGAEQGHPEIVVRVTEPPLPGGGDELVQWLLDHLGDNIGAGTRYAPGETILLGWRLLRVIERPDGMLGLEERDGDDGWTEHVQDTLRELWFQKEVAASLGLERRLSFPLDDDDASVAACIESTSTTVVLQRAETDRRGSSGWSIVCGRDHPHGPFFTQSLRSLLDTFPFAMQFFALPTSTTVRVQSPETTSSGRIRSRVTIDGVNTVPLAGSYLAMVNAD